jgi:DNA-directed RNA polymerase III subunit RPC3
MSVAHLSVRIDNTKITSFPSTPHAYLTDYITLLANDEVPFISKQDERGGGQYVVNLKQCTDRIKQMLVEDYCKEKLGTVACRIWRLLTAKGMLGEKEVWGTNEISSCLYLEQKVAKLAMVANKTAREQLYVLYRHGLVFMQVLSAVMLFFIFSKDVPKTVDHAPSRTFYLFYVSIPKTIAHMTLTTTRFLINLKSRRQREEDHAGKLIEKIERTDIKEDESLLTDSDRQLMTLFDKTMNAIRGSEIRLVCC